MLHVIIPTIDMPCLSELRFRLILILKPEIDQLAHWFTEKLQRKNSIHFQPWSLGESGKRGLRSLIADGYFHAVADFRQPPRWRHHWNRSLYFFGSFLSSHSVEPVLFRCALLMIAFWWLLCLFSLFITSNFIVLISYSLLNYLITCFGYWLLSFEYGFYFMNKRVSDLNPPE